MSGAEIVQPEFAVWYFFSILHYIFQS